MIDRAFGYYYELPRFQIISVKDFCLLCSLILIHCINESITLFMNYCHKKYITLVPLPKTTMIFCLILFHLKTFLNNY